MTSLAQQTLLLPLFVVRVLQSLVVSRRYDSVAVISSFVACDFLTSYSLCGLVAIESVVFLCVGPLVCSPMATSWWAPSLLWAADHLGLSFG